MTLNKSTQFPRCYHAVFGHGILLNMRVSKSLNDLCDCLFMDGTAPRTILTSCLLLFTEERTPSLPERRAIRRWLLSRSGAKPTISELADDFQIMDSDLSGTELDPETELTA